MKAVGAELNIDFQQPLSSLDLALRLNESSGK